MIVFSTISYATDDNNNYNSDNNLDKNQNNLSSFMEDKDVAVLRSIDKLYARTTTFEVPVGQTVKFGNSLFIRPQACRKTPPTKQPESATFLQVWETKLDKDGKKQTKWIFSGWAFASSPALSAIDHPIFDVWLIDCKNSKTSDKGKSKDTGADKENPLSSSPSKNE